MGEVKKSPSSLVGMVDWQALGWFNGRTGEIIKGVRIRSSHTVIDVGCGDGGFIGFVAGQGAEVIFIDRDAERLAATEARIRKSPLAPTGRFTLIVNPFPSKTVLAIWLSARKFWSMCRIRSSSWMK